MSARAETPTTRLPIVNLSLSEKTAKVLRKNIKFKWKGAQEWAGLSKNDLTELTLPIASFIGITPKQARKITVIFGDHYQFSHNDSPPSAICQPYQRDGVYSDITIVLNRSLEVALEELNQSDIDQEKEIEQLESLGFFDPEIDPDDYLCHLTAYEYIVWILSEELTHAHIFLMAKSTQKMKAWRRRYLEMLKKKASKLNDVYDTDLDEVAANRKVLRVLTYLTLDRDAKESFRSCYLESLRSRRVFMASFQASSFVLTGYQPRK